MPQKYKWAWDIYFVILLSLTIGRTARLLSPDSSEAIYMNTLTAFHPLLDLIYVFCIIQIFLSFLHLIPLAFYARGIPCLTPKFWQYLLIFRFISDLIGHPFAVNSLISLYHTNTTIFAIILAQMILTSLPSYAACYLYAFNRTEIFPKKF